MEEIDLYRSANLLIAKHGEHAGWKAADRYEELRAKGDVEGMDVWRRILGIINRLEAERPTDQPLQ